MGVGRIAAAAVASWLLAGVPAHADEPHWNSKPLSYWVGLLQRGEPAERALAARGLADLAAIHGAATVASALPHLIAAFDAELPELRGAAATGVGQLGPAGGAAVSGLTKLVAQDPDAGVRADAARSLGQIAPADEDVVETCAAALRRDSAAPVRQAAAAVLLQAGPAAARIQPALAGALTDADPAVRIFAAGAIGQLGEPQSAMPVLLAGPEHEDPPIRAESAGMLALVEAAHVAAVAPLTEALSDPEAVVRLAAAQALGAIGASAKPAVQSLWRLIRDPDESVREGALRAIKRIRG
jgi:HEAT repeat protein